mmetsp:Transcript_17385/g.37525  ORF Transcript_17385/g.37525 Transcript_17385/m.37525 type:complete len:118 (+) Transcript_17385:1013-1366(+)
MESALCSEMLARSFAWSNFNLLLPVANINDVKALRMMTSKLNNMATSDEFTPLSHPIPDSSLIALEATALDYSGSASDGPVAHGGAEFSYLVSWVLGWVCINLVGAGWHPYCGDLGH